MISSKSLTKNAYQWIHLAGHCIEGAALTGVLFKATETLRTQRDLFTSYGLPSGTQHLVHADEPVVSAAASADAAKLSGSYC